MGTTNTRKQKQVTRGVNMIITPKLRDDMNFLYGQINALLFLVDGKTSDLVESIESQYSRIVNELIKNQELSGNFIK